MKREVEICWQQRDLLGPTAIHVDMGGYGMVIKENQLTWGTFRPGTATAQSSRMQLPHWQTTYRIGTLCISQEALEASSAS